MILATRTKLIRQIHERLDAFQVAHGVTAAPLPELTDHAQLVQLCSADTLHRRSRYLPLPAAEVLIFDEAHLAMADTRAGLLAKYPNATIIGLTATPCSVSGRSLGEQFDALIQGPSVKTLIDAGMLVKPRIFNRPVVSTEQLKALPKDAANDYAAGATGELLSRPQLVGDVVGNWLRSASGKRTLAFGCNKAHAAYLTEEFCRAGVAAELLTDETPEADREAVFARLESGQTMVVCNCFLASYGVDLPSTECIVLARPTRSLALYLQMLGRGLRPSPGKTHCIVIDHGRCVETLGLPTEEFFWTLDESVNVNRKAAERQMRRSEAEKPRVCPECAHTWLVSDDGPACDACGWVPAPRAKDVRSSAAELGEMNLNERAITPQSPEVAQFFREAVAWYGYRWPTRWQERPKSGRWWAWSQTRTKFAFDPSAAIPRAFWEAKPAPTTAATNRWLKSQLIRYAKAKASVRGAA